MSPEGMYAFALELSFERRGVRCVLFGIEVAVPVAENIGVKLGEFAFKADTSARINPPRIFCVTSLSPCEEESTSLCTKEFESEPALVSSDSDPVSTS
jgi:hypothetical protein